MSDALLHGLPVILVAVLIVLIYRRSANQRPVYRLPQPWDREPILWTATQEPIPANHHGAGQHGANQVGANQVGADHVVGGGASGRW